MVCTFRYTPVDIPKSILVHMRNAKGPPTTRTTRVMPTQDWCSRARDKLKLSSRLVASATVGKYSELVGHSGGRYVGEAIAGHPQGVRALQPPSFKLMHNYDPLHQHVYELCLDKSAL
jgi:hypothetical protein